MRALRRLAAFGRELRRRRVFRVSVAYLLAGWLVVQVAATVAPHLELPPWLPTLVIVLVGLGFPIAVVLAWALEMTPEGIRRAPTSPAVAGAPPRDAQPAADRRAIGHRRPPPRPGRPAGAGRDGPRDPDVDADAHRWRRAARILSGALERDDAERERFLDRECAADESLRREVAALLRARATPASPDGHTEGLVDASPGGISTAPGAGSTPLPAEGQTVSHYRIVERLGGGGMGVVFRARDLRLEREVALKFLPRHLSAEPAAKERFLVEARAAAALDHPNICTVHEIGETEDGRLFIAMACYAGETLDRRIARGPLAPGEAIDVAIQVGRGLAHAHERGIVHRDVKPANVMLLPEGPVKILDFGLAKSADVSLTGPGIRMGTIAYMSPEQARGEAVDGRTDIWSLGVVLYEMVAGRRPFTGGNDRAVLEAIEGGEPPRLARLRDDVPAALQAVVDRALARPAAARYPDVGTLLRDLETLDPEAVEPTATDPGTPTLPPEGERRQACVLALRLSGYSEVLERLRPAELDELTERLGRVARETVEAHGGLLNEHAEEELVALFGVPVTHEDDFVRGVRAALALRERIGALTTDAPAARGVRLRVRAGVDNGLVVARPSRSGAVPYRVSGDTLRVAVRLAGRAVDDEILVSEECARLVRNHFETVPAEPLSDSDGGRPTRPHRVLGELEARTRLEAAARRGLTAYVGRSRELDTLAETLRSAVSGEGRFVTIEGEAGVGKSRLVHEFRGPLAEGGAKPLRGRCPSTGAALLYRPFVEVLEDLLELEPGQEPAERSAAVAERIGAISTDLEDHVPFYLHVLGTEDPRYPLPRHLEGDHLRLAIQESLVAVFTLAARATPLAILLEDWHWADEASDEVLGRMAEMVGAYPILLVATARPRPGAEWKGAAPHVRLHLRSLDIEASREIIRDVLGTSRLPAGLSRLLHDRTEGNPFFLEEICQALLEDGTVRVREGRASLAGAPARIDLPDTVQGVIRTRLDRLDAVARRVLLTASVIGREFSRPLLGDVWETADGSLESALETLRRHGLIHQVRVLPEAAFRFKHALTQDVAYDTLLHHRRRELHGRVGRALERRLEARGEEQPDILAHHFDLAEDWPRAVRYGGEAAERAVRLSQFSEALQMVERTLEWLSRLPDDGERREARIELLLRRERLCETLGLRDRQQEIIDELIPVLEAEGPDTRLAEIYLRQGDLHTLLRRFEAAEEALLRSLELSRAGADPVSERNGLRSLGLLRWHQGRNEEALVHMESALDIDRARNDREAISGDLANVGIVLKSMGQYGRGLEVAREALRLAEEIDNPVKQTFILHHLGSIHRELGEMDTALEMLRRAAALGEVHRLPIQQSFHLTKIAQIELERDRFDEAMEAYRQAVETNRRAGAAEALAQSLRLQADALFGLERYEEAGPLFAEAADLFERLGDDRARSLVLERQASVTERLGDTDAAAEAWSRLRDLHRRLDDDEGEVRAAEGLARCLRRGRPDQARELNAEALAAARRLGWREKEGELLNALGILAWERGRYQEALVRYEEALEVFRALGDRGHEGVILNSLGVTLGRLGRAEEARARLEEGLDLHRSAGTPLLEGHALAALGDLDLEAGDAEAARRRYASSLRLRREIGDRRGEGWMLHGLARAAASAGEDGGIDHLLRRAEEIGREVEDERLVEACRSLRPSVEHRGS